ncbi:MAG: excinuclease ABC subunit UvrC [Candidatus Neomarinimicrobiota bacterium]
MALKDKIKLVPKKPGVYLFHNDKSDIIYIGKAKNLRTRVRSYFQKNKYQTPKNQVLVARIDDLEWIVVANEVEALLTEANLIKKHTPQYNIDLRDDKSFPYIRVTKEPYPQVFLTRKIIKDGSKYFGPYTNIAILRQSLKALRRTFPIRTCTYYLDEKNVQDKKVKLCLDYHINKCEGPCEGIVSQEEYNGMIKRVIEFLHGNTSVTEDYITKQMEVASKEKRYEDAALARNQLTAVKDFKARQRKITANFTDRDVFALVREENLGIMVIIRIRQGRLFSREKISFQGLDDDASVLKSIITRFYMDGDSIPPEISFPSEPEDEKELIKWLSKKINRKIKFLYPQRGEKAQESRIAYQNAKLLLGEWIINRKKRKEFYPASVSQLQEDLNLKTPPRRIEAFDISHLGGMDTVASMVCFVDGKARKSEYRKYRIKTVVGIDDFAAMHEVVLRRYKRVLDEGFTLPDLILIDGGKGQLSVSVSALNELKIEHIPIIGLAKRLEEVFLPGNSEAQTISKQSPGLILLRRIRDEAHRFAITFQRQKRNKKVVSSIFDEISGMGQKRVKLLLNAFSGVKAIANTDIESVRQRTGIPEKICNLIIIKAKEYNK